MLGLLQDSFGVLGCLFRSTRRSLLWVTGTEASNRGRVEGTADADLVLRLLQLVAGTAQLRLQLLQQFVGFLEPLGSGIIGGRFLPFAGCQFDRLLPLATRLGQGGFRLLEIAGKLITPAFVFGFPLTIEFVERASPLAFDFGEAAAAALFAFEDVTVATIVELLVHPGGFGIDLTLHGRRIFAGDQRLQFLPRLLEEPTASAMSVITATTASPY